MAVFYGAQPLGNKIKYKEIVIYRIYNNKIAEGWAVSDVYGLQQQLIKK